MALACIGLAACGGGADESGVAALSDASNGEHILPVAEGTIWKYRVITEIPAAANGGAADESAEEEMIRRHIGRIAAGENEELYECFEISSFGRAISREFVEIHPDRVMMRGSARIDEDGNQGDVFLLDPPIPLVMREMRPGDALRELKTTDGIVVRNLQVVANESITVPTGTYEALRLLMTGMDGPLELRRTIWFASGVGIVREETTRYREDSLLYRSTQELTAFEPVAR